MHWLMDQSYPNKSIADVSALKSGDKEIVEGLMEAASNNARDSEIHAFIATAKHEILAAKSHYLLPK